MPAATLEPEHAAIEAAQLQEKKMSTKSIIAFIGITALSTFLITACSECCAKERGAANDHAGHEQAAHTEKMATAPAAIPEAAAKPIKNGFDGMPALGTDAFCPVMKQDFKVAADSTSSVYKGKTYVFCCPMCKPKFEADPKKYING
jgi:YHS domain-containing protein